MCEWSQSVRSGSLGCHGVSPVREWTGYDGGTGEGVEKRKGSRRGEWKGREGRREERKRWKGEVGRVWVT